MAEKSFDVLLFDLGGIFIEPTGVSTMLEWTRSTMSEQMLWDRWLHSPAVRKFESGKSAPREFAAAMIEEFELPVTKIQFLDAFASWSTTLFPGSEDLLRKIGCSNTLASMSNTNELHWNTARFETRLAGFFSVNLPSHLTGVLKPDPKAFTYASNALKCPSDRILFFDDNPANVKSANSTGMRAFQVIGPGQLSAKLEELGIL